MTDEANPAPADRTAQGGIPLNLAPLLTPYGQHQRLTIRVVYLPPRAELTRGQRNEDASWSLTPSELDGLELLLPDDSEPPPTVGVRIVGIDRNENASIVGQFEVPLPRSQRAKSGGGASAAQLAALQHRLDRRAAAAKRLAERKAARAVAAAEAKWRAESTASRGKEAQHLEQDWQQKIAAEQDARRAAEARTEEALQKVAALTGELEAAQERAAAAEAAQADVAPQPPEAEIEVRIAAEVDSRLADARAAWQAEAAGELEAARASWPQEATEALEAARAEVAEARAAAEEATREGAQEIEGLRRELAAAEALRRDLDVTRRELAAAQAAAEDLEVLRQELATAQSAAGALETELAQARAQAESDIEAQLANREQVLELEWREKLLGERTARQAAEAKAAEAAQQLAPVSAELEAARVRAAAAEAKATSREAELQRQGEEAEARLAREVETRLAAARIEWQSEQDKQDEARIARELEARAAASESGWESNRQRDGEARIAAAVDQAVKKAEIKAQSRLEQARADWEKESRTALAIAEGKWQAEAAKRLAAAHAEWNKNSEMELARGRSKLRGVARQQWRPKAWRFIKRAGLAAACLAAVYVGYTQYGATVREYLDWNRLKPKVAALADKVETTARDELESLTGKLQARLTIAAEMANVRSGPSTDTEVVARLPRDTVVTVLERRGEWIRVPVASAAGGEGWLHETLLNRDAR